jgi:ATP-dependent exoDNAse (exonuclease V) beta subunit
MSGDEGGDASGWTIDVPPDIDAVRVMSIHKAKGLGFPAVILLLYDKRIPYPEFHFEQDEDSVRVLKLTKAMAMDDAELRPIYEETQMRDDVGRINALYVAMTRAAAELHIIGVKGKRMSYPFDFLGVEPYVSKDASGRPIAPQHRPRAPRKKAEPEKPRAEKLRFRELFELPIETRETLNRNNIRRGEIAHALLAEVEYLSADGESELAEAASRLTPDEGEAAVMEDVKRHLVLFFQASGLLPYFEARPGRQVFTELEVCDKTGRERRLDRVVVDPGEVFVLEFKTGIPSEPGRRREWEEEDRRIFKAYLEIMKDIHPDKNVRGAFAFIDRGTVEAVP